MFSGGRDSTIAALRLQRCFANLVLVTVTSEHLVGIETVQSRLVELQAHLPMGTRWVHVLESPEMANDDNFGARTCLPCHRSYTATGFAIAKQYSAQSIAFGYTGYQSHWPEQTQSAIERLGRVMNAHGLELILPVYDIQTKEEAVALLRRTGLTQSALEQKCLRQVRNEALDADRLGTELAAWEKAIARSILYATVHRARVIADCCLADLVVEPMQGNA